MRKTLICAVAGLAMAGMAHAQTGRVTPENVNQPYCDADAESAGRDWRDAVEPMMMCAAQLLEERYIFEDQGRELGRQLLASVDRYTQLEDREAFSRTVTEDLRSWSQDPHMRLMLRPEEAVSEAGQGPRRRRGASLPDFNAISSGMLDGNIGYLRLRMFGREEIWFENLYAAMERIQGADAVIIDLRSNVGGVPAAVQALSAYFFAEDTHLLTRVSRDLPEMESWTAGTDVVAADQRMPDVPLYILTDERTASAAEAFTFGMRNTGRSIQVGGTTAGGGHFGYEQRLNGEFMLWVSRGAALHPETRQGFETIGIDPDIAVRPGWALDEAVRRIRSGENEI